MRLATETDVRESRLAQELWTARYNTPWPALTVVSAVDGRTYQYETPQVAARVEAVYAEARTLAAAGAPTPPRFLSEAVEAVAVGTASPSPPFAAEYVNWSLNWRPVAPTVNDAKTRSIIDALVTHTTSTAPQSALSELAVWQSFHPDTLPYHPEVYGGGRAAGNFQNPVLSPAAEFGSGLVGLANSMGVVGISPRTILSNVIGFRQMLIRRGARAATIRMFDKSVAETAMWYRRYFEKTPEGDW